MATTRKNVIVLGGGSAGVSTARELAGKLDTSRFCLIVVNPRPYYVHLPGLIRTVVTSEGNLEKEILMPWGDALKGKGEFKVGSVVSFTETEEGGEVVLSDGEHLPYAVLVLAPGSIWEGALALPEDPSAVQQHINSWRARFEKASSVLVVGGGAVGIELAGELKDFFPSKSVTIIHNSKKLLNDAYPDRYRASLLTRVRKAGAETALGDSVEALEPSEDGTVTTRNGKKIHADLVIATRGGRPNTAVVSRSIGAEALTASGHVKVLPTLQLPGHKRIFAAGDVIDWKEQKQAAKTAGHAAVIAQNVLSVLEGKDAVAKYKGSAEMIVTTVGRSGGSAYMGMLWGIVLGDWFARMAKSKGLVIEMMRGGLGLGKN